MEPLCASMIRSHDMRTRAQGLLAFPPPRLLPRSEWQCEFVGPARRLLGVQRDDNIHWSSSSRSFDWMGVGCLTSLPVWPVVVAIRPLISEHRRNSHLYA